MTDVGVGMYVLPDDHTGNPEHTHRLEGDCWAVERLPDPKTGELVEWLHVVRVWNGRLEFHMLEAARVGTATPSHPANIDSLIKLAGKEMLAKGRRTDTRLFALVHACEHILALPQARVDAPSVYGDDPEVTAGDVTGAGITVDHDKQVATLVGRLAALDNTAINEIQRDARHRQLPYLETGAQLTLGDIVTYDAILRRWEKHAARQQVAS